MKLTSHPTACSSVPPCERMLDEEGQLALHSLGRVTQQENQSAFRFDIRFCICGVVEDAKNKQNCKGVLERVTEIETER